MCRELAHWTEGKTIVQLEGVDNGGVLLHKNIRKCFRRGKYCILPIGTMYVVIHFRMTGKVVLIEEERKFVRRKMILCDGAAIGIVDQRRFSTFEILNKASYISRFEPFGEEVWPIHRCGNWYYERFGQRKGNVKALLLRQDIIFGLGNIMCSEVLFRIRCHPQTPAFLVSMEMWEALDGAIHNFVADVLEEEGGSEIQFVSQGGSLPTSFRVYGRQGEPCMNCSHSIVQFKMGGRATYVCPKCQNNHTKR